LALLQLLQVLLGLLRGLLGARVRLLLAPALVDLCARLRVKELALAGFGGPFDT